MKPLDLWLQRWRLTVAARWIPPGATVLDVGCHQGELFRQIGGRIGPSIGMDPRAVVVERPGVKLMSLSFAEGMPFNAASFDVITALATLEHIPNKESFARESARLVRPGGRVIITVPTPFADLIVHLLVWLRLADGLSMDEHHGFEPSEVPAIFQRHGFTVAHSGRFQMGLNRIFVLERTQPA